MNAVEVNTMKTGARYVRKRSARTNDNSSQDLKRAITTEEAIDRIKIGLIEMLESK